MGHFVSAKGHYASAMAFTSHQHPNTCQGLTDNSHPHGIPSCLAYSGDCSTAAGGQSCPDDPNASAWEISCWCKEQTNEFPPAVLATATSSTTIESSLHVDHQPDGTVSTTLHSNPKAQGSDHVRYQEISNPLVKVEWEDLYTNGNGDYNDYVGALEARECDSESPFPYSSSYPEGKWPTCNAGCNANNGTVCWRTPSADWRTTRYVVGIGIDDANGELDREAKGRTLHVTMAMYSAPEIAGLSLAVCPEPYFHGTPQEKTQLVAYGVDTQCADTGDHSGSPSCLRTEKAQAHFPVALAREQKFSQTTCSSSPTGPGDQFDARSPLACGGKQAGTLPVGQPDV